METVLDLTPLYAERDRLRQEVERLQEAGVKLCQQNDNLRADNRRWSKVADERSKENCELRQLLRDARDHVPWDVLARIDAALGVSRVEQKAKAE